MAPPSVHTPAGSVPDITGEQVPSDPLSEQSWQAPVQVVRQHVPCWQIPVSHCSPVWHEAPGGDGPHELLLHEFGGRHCEFVAQALKHLVPLQTNGRQGRASGATHWPLELHVDGGV
jgi:hypothetical protein